MILQPDLVFGTWSPLGKGSRLFAQYDGLRLDALNCETEDYVIQNGDSFAPQLLARYASAFMARSSKSLPVS
jgi:hypothetical protein